MARKLKSPDALAVSANIVNKPPMNFLHYHAGALHPYFPELPKGLNFTTLESKAQPDYEKPEVAQVQEPAEEVSEHSTLSRRLTTHAHNATWRPSAYRNWTGPEDFEWSLDWKPPFSNHRWLRVPDDKALNRTPVAHLTYEVGEPSNESWAIASQQHYSLLENIETDKLNLYNFDRPWDMKGEYIRINLTAILGSDLLDTGVFNRSDSQGQTLPHDTGRREFCASCYLF